MWGFFFCYIYDMGLSLQQLKDIFSRPFWQEVIRTENPGFIQTTARQRFASTLAAGTIFIIPLATHGIPSPSKVTVLDQNGREVEALTTISPTSEVIVESNCSLFNHQIIII